MRFSLSHLLIAVAVMAVAIVWFRSLPPRHSGASRSEHGGWADGSKSLPRFYWGTVRQYDETKFGYMIRVTDKRFVDREIEWLKIDQGRLYVHGRQYFAKSDTIQLAFAENDGPPRFADLNAEMANEFLSLRGYMYGDSSLPHFPEAQEMNDRIEEFWEDISTANWHLDE